MARTKKEQMIAYVIPSRLNFRDGIEGRVIDTIPAGTAVEVISKKKGWCSIRFRGVSGWVVAEYLKEADHD